jgi:hypothetical protein
MQKETDMTDQLYTLKSAFIKESNDFSRSTLTALISWFTVFVSVNYVAIGWVAQALSQKGMRLPVTVVSAVFISQNGLGIYACWIARSWFKGAHAQVIKIGSELKVVRASEALGALFPHIMYSKAIFAMIVAQFLLALVWLVLMSIVLTRSPIV